MTGPQEARPLLSVALITYNHARFIAQALESAVAQETTFPFEVVVGEDCSTDGTRAVVEELARRHPGLVRPLLHPRNVGGNPNLQAVLDACRGDYIAQLDGDDFMHPGKLQRQFDFLEAHPDVVAVFHQARVLDSETGKLVGLFTPPGTPPSATIDDLVSAGSIYAHSSKVLRRSALREPFDDGQGLAIDWLLHIQNARYGRIAYLDEVLGTYRVHPGSYSREGGVAAQERIFRHRAHTIAVARTYPGVTQASADRAEALAATDLAIAYLRAGRDADFAALVERSRGLSQRTTFLDVSLKLRRLPWLLRALSAAHRRLAPPLRSWLARVGGAAGR